MMRWGKFLQILNLEGPVVYL